MTDLYYASGLWLDPGNVVQPGNWGRVVLGAGSAGHAWYGLELFLEEIRRRDFADRPSRLTSLMTSESPSDADRWRDQTRRFVYQLEHNGHEPFKADVSWINAISNSEVRGVNDVRECAVSYWAGDPRPTEVPPLWELLTADPAIVIATVQ